MTDDDSYRTRGQYKAAARSIYEFQNDWESGLLDERGVAFTGPVLVALSNLAVAEAIHELRQQLHKVPVVVNTTGSVDLNPDAVAGALARLLNKAGVKRKDGTEWPT